MWPLIAVLVLMAGATPNAPSPGADVSGDQADVLWTVEFPEVERRAPVALAAGLSGDGGVDVLLAYGRRGEPGGLLAFDGTTGERLWARRAAARPVACAVDPDGDGACDVAAAFGETLTVLDGSTGAPKLIVELSSPVGEIAAGDLTGDERCELVCTMGEERNERAVVFDSESGEEVLTLVAGAGEGRLANGFSRPAVASIGGQTALLMVEDSVVLVRFAGDGSRVWEARLGTPSRLMPRGVVTAGPIAADVLGTCCADVVVGCFAGSVVVVDGETGEELVRKVYGAESHRDFFGRRRVPAFLKKAIEEAGEPVSDFLAIELDGVPGLELVFGCSDGSVYALAPRTGRALWSCECGGKVYDAPAPIGGGDVYDAPASIGGGDAYDAPAPIGGGRSGVAAPRLLAWSSESVVIIDSTSGAVVPCGTVTDGASSVVVGDFADRAGLEAVVVQSGGAAVRCLGSPGGPTR